MRLDAVNEIICQAKETERRSRHFMRTLRAQSDRLPDAISIEQQPAVRHLLGFIIEYIELAPMTLACIASSAREAQVEDMFRPFLSMALEYFVQPSIIPDRPTGLDGLMIRAYQCHRLIEELYENNTSLRSSKICEMESTQANLLVHSLIGEPFANEIDESVLFTLGRLIKVPEYYTLDLTHFVAAAQGPEWQQLCLRWQKLLPDHHIRLNFQPRIL